MTAFLIRLLAGAQAHWNGATPLREDGSVPQRVYFANHTSNLDGPVIWASLPPAARKKTRPVAAKDYWEKGGVRRYCSLKIFNCLLVTREGFSVSDNPLRAMSGALNAGDSLILFPEGTRSKAEDVPLGPFRAGLFHLARKHPEVELVPTYLENLNRILPKGEFIYIPLLAAVRFGAPIFIKENESKQDFLTRASTAILELKKGREC